LSGGEDKMVKASNASGTQGEYFYDGDGKRVKKIAANDGGTTIFVYDAAGKLVAEYSQTVASVEDAKVAYLTNDHLGSPRINTDRDGNVTARHDYHPFGEEIVTSQRTGHSDYTPDSVRKQFTGYERDEESGLDFAQARFYAKNLGRFSSTDPILITPDRLTDPQRINLFSYARNNPLKYTDDSGEEIVLKLGMTQKQLDALVNALVETYMTTGGYQFFEDMAVSTSKLTLGTGDLSAMDEDGRVTYGHTGTEGSDISITLDLDRREANANKASEQQRERQNQGQLPGMPPKETLTVPDSAKEWGKHEVAHGIDARKDPAGHKKASDESKLIKDYDKKPSEIRRKAIQKKELNQTADEFKGKKNSKTVALEKFKKLIKYDQYTVSK